MLSAAPLFTTEFWIVVVVLNSSLVIGLVVGGIFDHQRRHREEDAFEMQVRTAQERYPQLHLE